MNNNQLLGLIGLAMKAGKICFGADSVEQEMKKKKVKLVLIAQDSSERTKTKFQKLCKENQTECLIIGDIETLSKSIGKVNKAIIGIEEENIAKQIQKINYGGESIG